MRFLALLLSLSLTMLAQNYTAVETSDHGVSVVRLADAEHGVEVSIVPSIGNIAYEMKVHGKNILYFPSADLSEFQQKPGRALESRFWRRGATGWTSRRSGPTARSTPST